MAYFIQTDLKLKYGSIPRFTEVMKTLVPFLGTQGWTLVGAYQAIVGNLTQVMHIWEVENLDCIPTALTSVQSAPHIVALVSGLSDYVVDENLQLVTKTAYSP